GMSSNDPKASVSVTWGDDLFQYGKICIPARATILFEDSRVIALLFRKEDAPNLMEELGHLRSQTFASSGLKGEYGLDKYDDYYQQIVVLDREDGDIVGGMRVGQGDKLLSEYGEKVLYLTKYWSFSEELLEIVRQSVDIGRLWVQPMYQK